MTATLPHVVMPRHTDPRDPAQTVCAGGNHTAAVCAFLGKYHGEKPGDAGGRYDSPENPLRTADTQNRHCLASATLIKNNAGSDGVPPTDPLHTVTSGGRHMEAAAFLARIGHTGGNGGYANTVQDPLTTVVSKAEHCLAAASLTKLYGTCQTGVDAREPMPTATGGGNHIAEVRAFLVKYYGTGGQDASPANPMHTLTAKARMGLVTVQGEEYQITDIGLRMLEPVALLRAQFGRFASEYVLYGTKARQVAAIGNSVPPEVAEAIVRANFSRKNPRTSHRENQQKKGGAQ